MRSAMAAREAGRERLLGIWSRSRTTSDLVTLRSRDSASISATSGSGSRTVRVVFIGRVYYGDAVTARQRRGAVAAVMEHVFQVKWNSCFRLSTWQDRRWDIRRSSTPARCSTSRPPPTTRWSVRRGGRSTAPRAGSETSKPGCLTRLRGAAASREGADGRVRQAGLQAGRARGAAGPGGAPGAGPSLAGIAPPPPSSSWPAHAARARRRASG